MDVQLLTPAENSATAKPEKKTLRYIWGYARAVLQARWSLRHATTIGPRTRVSGWPVIRAKGTLAIGDRVLLDSTVAKIELSCDREAVLEIGERTFINYGTSIGATQLVRIGPRCSIGTYCILIDNSFHRLEPERRLERPPSAPIVLEGNVWLGARVIVLSGVTIGADSVIGAGSVVTRDIPPRVVAAGVPAKVIRQL